MYETSQPEPLPPPLPCFYLLRHARSLPDLFDRAAEIFRQISGASFALLYLAVTSEEAVELSFAGTPPSRSPEVTWGSSLDPHSPPWSALDASEVLLIQHQQKPFALVVLGPRETLPSDQQTLTLHQLCHATGEGLEHSLLQTRALAADFQEQRANRHRHQARHLDQRLRQVSHDMRNHLVPMLYATEELQELLSTPEALKLIVNLERQIMLADQLSKQSIASFFPPSRQVRCDLGQVARDEAEGWRSAFGRRQQAFTCQLPDEPLWVDGHLSQHHQVLGNLLSNAHKYTPPGGRIRLSVTADQHHCLIEVSDSGRGIAPLVRRRLFGATVREDSAIDGHGIGLTNVQTVLNSLGGAISVISQPGCGSTFQVRLPRQPDRQA